jgi:hypothetical protein
MAQFEKGQSGNPNGRPKGSRNKAAAIIDRLLEGDAESIARQAIDRAKDGDATMIRLCMDRLCPPRKERHLRFALPDLKTADDAVKAVAAIAAGVAQGTLTPGEAADLSRFVESFAKALEIADLEARLLRLEQRAGARDGRA